MLNQLNQEATAVLTRYGSMFIKGMYYGADNLRQLYTDLLNLHVLCGYMSELFYDGAYKLGLTTRDEAEVQKVRAMIQFYNGREEYDVSSTPDFGGGSVIPTEEIALTYRAGQKASTVGSNTVLFYVNASLAPFDTANYIIHCWNIGTDGSMQNNVAITQKTAAGFTASDIMDAGTLYYEAVLIT